MAKRASGLPSCRASGLPSCRSCNPPNSNKIECAARLKNSEVLVGSSSAAAPAEVSPYMSSRADVYRQRAADAKRRAVQAKDLSVKKAFEEVGKGWLVLAEQMEWIDRQRPTFRDEENDRSL